MPSSVAGRSGFARLGLLAALAAACSSGLSDAAVAWCADSDNYVEHVRPAAIAVGIKFYAVPWGGFDVAQYDSWREACATAATVAGRAPVLVERGSADANWCINNGGAVVLEAYKAGKLVESTDEFAIPPWALHSPVDRTKDPDYIRACNTAFAGR